MKTDLDQLVHDCKAALGEATPQIAMKEVLKRAVANPSGLLEALPPDKQGTRVLHVDDDLTIFQLINEPGYVYLPHDHGLWSVAAFFAGRERNQFWRQTDHGLEKAGGKEYGEGDVVLLGHDVIHSIENPLKSNNAALHVFAGNEFTVEHSQWDLETLEKSPFSNEYGMSVYPELA